MNNTTTIQNDLSYLLLQQLNMDYNFWNVIFAHIVLVVAFFGVIFLIGMILVMLDWI